MSDTSADHNLAYYPIRIVSSETGVNAITLRAWERRYGLLTPKRTAKGHRLYTEDDIQLIRKVVTLLNRGIPISQAQAMIDNGDVSAETPVSVPNRPSQWQHYREELNKSVLEFDDSTAAALFTEVTQFFPIDVALRFLFIPLYRHLQENVTQHLGPARLRFYAAFLQSRLAWRLSEQQTAADAKSVIIANCSDEDDIDLLLLALLLKQHGLEPVWFSGTLTPLQLTELAAMPRWQALILNIGHTVSEMSLNQLQQLTRQSGQPVFTLSQGTEASTLLSRGLISVQDDLHQAALNIRDMLSGIIE
ncbi:MAG: hypothetical protein CMI03_16350 [Oceanospirillaceae bacterium]|uniref:MerR family transcriptional regulator n=1 Tax=unclassified Thalassolituus TaxID=2624967 RepID=UPI000C67E58C|nr:MULTISPECIES: MerR family transcriptional regulator [unclassified Thalassolituus]MAS25767.1 hypothetical protein [Oceanospirillaceae bacterium]MBL33428.1 hypothetical protein [Oceanospirillaceae bacterium]MBS54312.1 hypothetical protein [Oceanospirillaceae bacterium]|tara:strand:+ start:2004 stop:2918 length:915 start_codon:yes stop_codon:yes gene_type:complete